MRRALASADRLREKVSRVTDGWAVAVGQAGLGDELFDSSLLGSCGKIQR